MTVRKSHFFVVLVAGFASVPETQGALTANFDLNGNGVQESSAVSSLTTTLGICAPCTVTHTVNNGINAAQNFNWTWPGFAGRVNGGAATSTTFTTYLSVVEAAGNIAFNPAAVAGQADYYKPVVSAVAYYAGDLISTLFRSPANIEFKSTLSQTGAASFDYNYEVTNYTGSSVTFDWIDGLSGTLSPFGSMSLYVAGTAPGVENIGFAEFQMDGEQFMMPAHFWTPIPLPSALILLLSAIPALMLRTGLLRG